MVFIKISPEQSEEFLLSGIENAQVVLIIALFVIVKATEKKKMPFINDI